MTQPVPADFITTMTNWRGLEEVRASTSSSIARRERSESAPVTQIKKDAASALSSLNNNNTNSVAAAAAPSDQDDVCNVADAQAV